MLKAGVRARGFTFIEVMTVVALLSLLAGAALPVAKTIVKREKEIELRRSLRVIREALDAYKLLADEKKIEIEEDSEGYPPDLETLVEGVEVSDAARSAAGPGGLPGGTGQASASSKEAVRIVKLLRRIPIDPMTNSTDWGLRSYQDDSDSENWGEENVYDVYTKSRAKALDGTRYRDW